MQAVLNISFYVSEARSNQCRFCAWQQRDELHSVAYRMLVFSKLGRSWRVENDHSDRSCKEIVVEAGSA